MYLTRLTLNSRSPSVRQDLADCRRMHRTIMSAFPPIDGDARAAHRVLHRIEPQRGDGSLTVLVQSITAPNWAGLPARYIATGYAPEVKVIDPSIAAIGSGMVLNFRLRANPTKKIDTKSGPDGQRRNGRRKKLQGETAQIGWLQRKASLGGFTLLDARRSDEAGEVGYKTLGAATEGEPMKMFFGSVLFEGTLRVTDADKVRRTLVDGIGSGKAFGFGLLSLAPYTR